jgi:hypothetical protein
VVTAIGQEVVHELQGAETHETIASLVDLGVVDWAGVTELVDTVLEEVVVDLLVVLAESTLEIRVVLKVVLEIEDIRAGTALTDTVLVPVVMELAIVVVEGVLEVRILVVIEISIEDKILRIAGHGDRDGAEAHGGHHALLAAHVHVVPHELSGSKIGQEGIDGLVHVGVIGGAGLTQLVDTILEDMVVSLGVVRAESLLEVRVLAQVETKVKDVRACTALLDTILVPVLKKLGIVVVEGILEVRILVVIEISIEDHILGVASGHGSNADGGEAHGGHQTLTLAHVLEVPEELTRSEVGEPGVDSLVDLRVVDRAGLTHLVDAVLEEVVVDLLEVPAESLLEIGVAIKVEGKIEDSRAGTAFADTVLVPVVVELVVVVVEGVLEVRILVVIEISIEDNLLHVHGTIRRNTSKHRHGHHFRKGFVSRVFST